MASYCHPVSCHLRKDIYPSSDILSAVSTESWAQCSHSPSCYHLSGGVSPWTLVQPVLGVVHSSCQQWNSLCTHRDSADEQLLFSNWKRATESTVCLAIYGVLTLRFALLSFILSLSFLPRRHLFPMSYNMLPLTTFLKFFSFPLTNPFPWLPLTFWLLTSGAVMLPLLRPNNVLLVLQWWQI